MGSTPMFPNIASSDLIKFYSLLNMSLKNKKLFFLIPLSPKFFLLATFFKKLGLIKNFLILTNFNKKKILKISFFFIKSLPVVNYIRLITTPSKIYTISYVSLRLLTKKTKNSLFLISTSRGLLNHNDAIKIKTGGQVCFQITF